MNSSRASSLAIRSSSRWRKRVSTSLEPVVLLRRRAQRLRQQRRSASTRSVSSPRRDAERDPVDADQVAEVELQQRCHPLRAELVDPRLELDPPGAVDEVEERHPALPAAGGQPAGDAVRDRRSPRRAASAACARAHRRDRLDAVELVRERLDAGGPQRVELAAPRGEEPRTSAGSSPTTARGYFGRRRSW